MHYNVLRANAPTITLNNFTSNVINHSTNRQNVSLVPISVQRPSAYVLQSNGMGGLQLVAQRQPVLQQRALSLRSLPSITPNGSAINLSACTSTLSQSAVANQLAIRNQSASAPVSGLILNRGSGLLLNGGGPLLSTTAARVPAAGRNVHSFPGSDNVHRMAAINRLRATLLSNAQSGGARAPPMAVPMGEPNAFSSGIGRGCDDGGHLLVANADLHERASCHQCKTKKDVGILYYCTQTRPFSNNSFKTKVR